MTTAPIAATSDRPHRRTGEHVVPPEVLLAQARLEKGAIVRRVSVSLCVQRAGLARCSAGPVHAAAPAVVTKDSVVGDDAGAHGSEVLADCGRAGSVGALILVRWFRLHIA